MTNDPITPPSSRAAATDVEQARRDRRRRTIYASLAGWALLGAAGTGIVACSAAQTGEPAGAAVATTQAASSSGAAPTGTASSSTASSSTAASSTPSSAAPTSAAPTSAAESATSSADTTSAAAAATTYQDGTYTATGTYQSPGGEESVTITLTLAGDTITDASGQGGATRPPSSQYQAEFLDNFASQIVGKNIDEVSLSKVAGSSLTSGGFNQAVSTIKNDARA